MCESSYFVLCLQFLSFLFGVSRTLDYDFSSLGLLRAGAHQYLQLGSCKVCVTIAGSQKFSISSSQKTKNQNHDVGLLITHHDLIIKK